MGWTGYDDTMLIMGEPDDEPENNEIKRAGIVGFPTWEDCPKCINAADGGGCTIQGSANLSHDPIAETITCDDFEEAD